MTEKNGQYKISVEKRLTSLEVGFDGFREEVRNEFTELKENHIKHLDDKMWWGIVLAISVLVGVIVDLSIRLLP